MSIKWVETVPEVYSAVYSAHFDQLTVFGSYTHCDEPVEMITEWGFVGADYPLLKSERHGDE
jgi:hypothetical protein